MFRLVRPWFEKDCPDVNLFDLAQRPYRADEWRKCKQEEDKAISKNGGKTTYGLLDLKSLIISRHLYNKDCLMAFIQDHGRHL